IFLSLFFFDQTKVSIILGDSFVGEFRKFLCRIWISR
ncbi:unnamed protein product, partial [Arabidopsis halleri]